MRRRRSGRRRKIIKERVALANLTLRVGSDGLRIYRSLDLVTTTPPPHCVLRSGSRGTRTLSSHRAVLSSEQCATPTGTCNSAPGSKNSPNRIRPVYTGNTWLSQGDSNKHLVEERPVLLDNLEQPGFESERNPPHPVESRQSRGPDDLPCLRAQKYSPG